jgi:Zn-dependent protease with chaperone function
MFRWNASYFDGVSAARRPVSLGSTAEGIAFALNDGTVRHWTSREFRLHIAPGRSHVRFERQPYRGEALEVNDPEAVAALLAQTSLGVARKSHIFALVVGCIAAGIGVYTAVPYLTAGIARLIPHQIEERLGRVVVAGIVPPYQRLKSAELDRLSRPILDRLFAAADPGWRYQVTWQRTPQVNALAAPGGQLVVYCGLVDVMQTPEELAAVLAHEVSHVVERHSTRNLVRTMGARMAFSLLGGTDVLIDGAAMLGSLHYMRADEEAADSGGQMLLVRANIDPSAMADASSRFEKDGVHIPAYLSSHPDTAQRKARAAKFAKAHPDTSHRPLLAAGEWRRLQSACITN